MTRVEFDGLVRKVEARFANRPLALRLRLAGLVVAGYAVFSAELLLALVVSVLCAIGWVYVEDPAGRSALAVFGGLIFCIGIARTWRVLRFRIAPPEGRELRRHEAPALFAMLDEVRSKLGAACFHRVFVDGRCNAGVVQVPRLGLFGWARNHLVLGLPLLEAMSVEEVRAVVAHECCHLSAEHGRFGNWLYRLRSSWEQQFERDRAQRAPGHVSLRPAYRKFIGWFWPRFNAHAFVLSRANEYEADATAARLAEPALCASALLRVEYFERLVREKFWPDFWNEANRSAEPPQGIFLRLRDTLHAGVPDAESARWVEQAFRSVTSNADTHPALTDRMRALGFVPADPERGIFPPPPQMPRQPAADALLGPILGELRSHLEKQWRNAVDAPWKEAHARAHSLHHRLESLGHGTIVTKEDADSLWEQASVRMRLENDAAAAPLLLRLLAIEPAHKAGSFCLGRHLLAAGDPAGEAHLERAMDGDESLVEAGCQLLIGHHRSHGRADRVRELEQRLDAHEAALAASHRERNSVTAADEFVPHDLTAQEFASLQEILSRESGIRFAWLARKRLAHFPKQRLFVLVVDASKGWFGGSDAEDAVVRRLISAANLPGRALVVSPRGVWRAVARKVQATADARVCERGHPIPRSAARPASGDPLRTPCS